MADVVAKLQVDSSQFDQKLKSAVEQMTKMEAEVRRTGATFAYADKEELAFIQSLGNMDTQTNSAKGKLREMTDSLLALSQTYKQLTDEEKSSPFGQALAASIDQLKGRASEIKDAMADMNREISGMASDTQTFDQIAGSVGLMVSVFQVGQGALQAFGVENEEAAQAIAKLQGAMAVTSGLQKIQNALQKESNVMLGVSKVQTLAAAAAETMATKAKQGNAVATKAATVAQKALNLVANANPYILLATAVAAVGTALWAMSKASKAAADAEEKRMQAEEEATRKANETREAFVNASADAMASASHISALQIAYMKSNSEMEKTGVLKQAQEEFKKLGISCNSVTEAQTILMSKGGQIIELLKMQGSIAALNAVRMEKYKESFNNLLANGYDVAGAAALAGASKEVRELDDQIIKLQTKSQNVKGDLGIGEKKSTGSTTVKVEPVIPEGSAAALKKQIADLQKQWDNATSDEDRSGIQKQIDAAQKALDEMSGKAQPIEVPITFTEQGVSDLGKQIKDKMSKLEIGSGDYLIAASNLLDFTTFENLLKAATERGVQPNPEWMSSIFEDIKIGADVDPETWQALVDNINQKLADLGLEPIKLDVDTGGVTQLQEKLEELPTQFEMVREQLDKLSSGVGAISTIGNAFNDLKGIGEDLASAFSGEMDAWDALMTVFNSGISIMQTVIGVMEAINTLQELSSTLSKKKVADQAAETTAVVTGKGTEAAANLQEAGTSMTAAGANAAESSSAAGKAVAGIPIVGPILAVAAIAAVLAATFAAMSKAKSAGNFSTGGIVPGNSYSGDNLSIGVNSQELVLNRAQTSNLASQLQGGGVQTVQVTGMVAGSDLYLVNANYAKEQGLIGYAMGLNDSAEGAFVKIK